MALHLVKEFADDGRAYRDADGIPFDDATRANAKADALAYVATLEDQDRANGFYRPGRWRVLSIS